MIRPAIFLLSWMAATLTTANQPAPELELIKAHRLAWPGNFQPSGLTWCRGRFLTISDRHDLEIQEIELSPDAPAQVRLYRKLRDIPPAPQLPTFLDRVRQSVLTLFNKQYDWEGITCDREHNIYLASEAYSALLKVPESGSPQWITLGEHPTISSREMLVRHNSGIEGVHWIGGDEMLIAAEQGPAGFIRCRLQDKMCIPTRAVVVSDLKLPINIRTWDISGLAIAENRLYSLERYYSRICRRDWHHFRIEACFSFKGTETAPAYLHADSDWGQAEGLFIQGERIYVIIDNNGRSLLSDPTSEDTWLFELKRPEQF